MRLAEITQDNSTVDGCVWDAERFAALDFGVELYSDGSYKMGCLKYVPCSMDDDPTIGHRIRSTFAHAEPFHVEGKWVWKVYELADIT